MIQTRTRTLQSKATALAALLFAAFLASFFVITGAQAQEVGITTGLTTGTYYKAANDIASVCSTSTKKIKVYESSGSLANIERVLSDKRTQYGITQQDALTYMALDNNDVKNKIKMIFPLYNEDIVLVATVASGIRGLNDLRGRRVVTGAENSGNWLSAMVIKSKTEIDWKDVTVTPGEGITQLLLGQADAMFVVAGSPVKVLADLGGAAKGKLKLVPISHPALDGFYIKTTVPEGTYDWSPARNPTYAVKSILVTFDFKSQYQEEIGILTKCIVNNLATLQEGSQYHPKWREVDPQSYGQVKWPVHPVAERFLKRNGGK